MATVSIAAADAVVAALNAAALSQAFTAARGYAPVHEVDDLAALAVVVVPRDLSQVPADLDSLLLSEPAVAVTIRKKVADTTNAACDPLVVLEEEIVRLFCGHAFRFAGAAAVCTGAECRPLFDPAELDQRRVFSGSVYLTFRLTS